MAGERSLWPTGLRLSWHGMRDRLMYVCVCVRLLGLEYHAMRGGLLQVIYVCVSVPS